MAITFRCDGCEKELRVGDDAAGKSVRCPHCKSVVKAPLDFTGPSDPPAKIRRSDDEDDRPRKPKRSSRDDDDEDDEVRPARRNVRSSKRRDDDDDEYEEEDEERTARRKKAAFRFASLGVRLYAIGGLLYALSFVMAGIGILILCGAVVYHQGKPAKQAQGWRELPKEDEETVKARRKKAEALSKEFVQTRVGPADEETRRHIAMGVGLWSGSYNGGVVAMGFLVAALLAAALILMITGQSFLFRAPIRSGAVLGMTIASLATTVFSFICLLIVVFTLLPKDGGLCALMPFSLLNPFIALSDGFFVYGLATWIVLAVGALFYILPVLEVGRMVLFAIYQMLVGKKLKDRSSRSTGFLMIILVPSVILGVGLLLFLGAMALPTEKALREAKADDLPSPWPAGILLTFNALLAAGMVLWFSLGAFTTSRALRYAK